MPAIHAEEFQLATRPNPRNSFAMFQIFQNVQYNVVQHKKYVKEMTKLYKKLEQDAFRESFSNALHYLFTFGDTSANVDRVIQFIATFCTSLDDEEEFLFFIFEIIFKCQCVSGQSVRYRASQLLAAVLQALGEDASLDDDLCDKLLTSQMQRLQDARGAVRCRAALALQRLQNPLDPDDEVTRAYRFHMSCDPSSSVRRAIVMSIAKCTRNVPFVLERLCDVDEAVRRAAFLYISAINVTQLKVRQRVLTLKVGLTERSLRVRRVVEEILIPSWLSSFKGNVIDLLKAIRLDNAQDAKDSQYVAGKLLESLFKRLPVSELLEWLPTDKTLRLIPAEKLNKETAWYWRHLAEHLNKLDDDETLESVLPDLVVLTGYIRAIVKVPCPSQTEDPVAFNSRQYILHECACLLRVYDAGDQVGRTALQKLIYDVLTGDNGPLNPEVIRAFVSASELVLPEISPRVEFISGVISELREPSEPDQTLVPPPPPVVAVESTETKMQRAKLRVSLNVAMEAQEEAVRDQNYALAAECKAKVEKIQKQLEELNIQLPPPPPVQVQPTTTIREKACDAVTLNKCLTILNSALDTAQITTITPLLEMIFKELEMEIFKNVQVLENALETVALYGMLDKKFAQDYKDFFFTQLIDLSDEKIVTKALTCIVDLLCVHGLKVFDDDVEKVDDNEVLESNVSLRKKKNRNESSCCEEDGTISESAVSVMPIHSTVIEVLLKAMEDPCSAFRLVVVEGFCRLFMLGHLESPGILSRLLLLWFNPATAEEDVLRQTIGVFFQSFASSVEGAQEQIQKATLPTLRALANAPSSSPIAEIDQEAVLRFIVSLMRVNHEVGDSQAALAVLLCSYLARRTCSYEASLVCRILALLSPPRDVGVCADLSKTLRKLCEKTTDKQSCRNLTRYLGALEAVERISLNKLPSTGQAEGTMASEDLTLQSLRATGSLPQPQARSTRVIINETVEEEKDVDIDQSSPTDPPQTIVEEPEREILEAEKPVTIDTNVEDQTTDRNSSGSDGRPTDSEICDSNENVTSRNGDSSDSSSGISPEKKQKISKRGRKNLSLRRSQNKKDNVPKSGKKILKGKTPRKGKLEVELGDHEKGVKRTRSQRSLVDVDRARENQEVKTAKTKSKIRYEKEEEPAIPSNVTTQRSTRNTRSSTGSESSVKSGPSQEVNKKKRQARGKKTANKARSRSVSASPITSPSCRNISDSRNSDETELHTIVYDQELVQSLLDDSEVGASRRRSAANVTVPESPEVSNTSDSEEEFVIKSKGKGKR